MSFWRKEPPEFDDQRRLVKGGMFPSQRAWWDLPNFVRLLVMGYGGGKTQILCKRQIALALHNAPAPSAIVSPTYRLAMDTVCETMVELLHGKRTLLRGFDWGWRKSENLFFIRYAGRLGRIWVLSGDDAQKLKGRNLGAAGIDEPFIQEHAVLEQMVARVRHPKASVLEVDLTGCVTRDSLVLTPAGFHEIGEFDRGRGAGTFAPIDELVFGIGNGFHRATKFYDNGEDETIRLRTNLGLTLEATPDHPVCVMGEDGSPVFRRIGDRAWKYGELGQVRVGDHVAVVRGMEVWGGQDPCDGFAYRNRRTKPLGPLEMTDDLAYGLGVWLAEGSFDPPNHRFTVTCGDDSVLRHFEDLGMAGFKFRRGRADQTRLNSVALAALFRYLGMPLVRAPQKTLPMWVLRGRRSWALHFLAGMWDGDGHVCRDGRGGIGYSTSSESLAQRLQLLLLNLGVVSRLTRIRNGPTKKVPFATLRFQVVTRGQDANRLADLLPLRIERKRKLLALYRRPMRDSDVVPNQGQLLLAAWEKRRKRRWRNGSSRLEPNKIVECTGKGTGSVAYSTIRDFVSRWDANEDWECEEIEVLRANCADWYRWMPITELEPGRAETVDFVIPETHSFTPNGILSLQTPEQLNWGFDLAEGELSRAYDVGVVHGSTRENQALPGSYVERLEQMYDEKTALAFIEGQFVNLVRGLVFHAFSPLENIIERPIPPGAELGVGMDFNVDPMASVVFWHTKDEMHWFDEIELPNSDTEEMCAELRERYWDAGLRDAYPDPSCVQRHTNAPGGKSDKKYIEEAGFTVHLPPGNKYGRRDRFNATNGMLKPSKGRIRLTVSPRCKKLIKYLRAYAYALLNTKEQKAMSHLIDAATYPVAFLFPRDRTWARQTRFTGA